jgi:hypothetical protein
MERPPFKAAGAWLACGALQVHLILHPRGSFRTGNIDNDDCHFAFRIDDFDGAPSSSSHRSGLARNGKYPPIRGEAELGLAG